MELTLTPLRLLRFLLIFTFCSALCIKADNTQAQVSVTATSGASGPTSYTTVKDAFDAINLGTHQGTVTVTVTASTTELATASLNASGTGSASYARVLVKPGSSATPTISGAIANGPVIKLNGANNVMIDGSNNGSASRDLSIANTSATTPQVVVIGSVGAAAAANDTLKNCVLVNGSQNSSALIVSDAAAPGTAGYFNNIGIINNSVQKAYIGMYFITVASGTNGSGTYVANNNVNATGANALRYIGIYLQGLNGARVDSNQVGNFEGVNGEFDRGIWLASGTNNTSITGNTVSGLSYSGTGAFAPIGINISPAVTGATIAVTGNTVSNISSAGSGTSTGIYFYSLASGAIIDKNKVSNIKNSNTGGFGAAGIMLAGSLTASAVNVLNNFIWDVAAYGTNLWTAASNGNGIVADGGGGYNIYYNSVWLNTSQTATTGTRAAAVLISSNITTANSINLRNNLLVNTQTVGNANSRMALVVTANTNVLNTFNYNDYYSASGNLVGQGTNLTIWNTIAQVQTNMGGNSNSVSILPAFTSGSDLHLPVASNTSLNNIGVNIAGISNDIDNDTRTTTPDMGADEFGNCLPVVITNQPNAAAFCAGGNTTLTVAATNGNVIQWQVNTGSGFSNLTNGGVYSGATSGTLSITGAAATMNGYMYRAQLSYGAACPQTASNSVTLVVNPRPSAAVTSSGPTTFCTGGTDTLSVPLAANVSYQWYNTAAPISGATSASYVTTTTETYTAVATNTLTGCADTSVSTVITVGSGPVAAITPSGASYICQGKSITLSAGTTPGVTYQWALNGAAISGATSNAYSTSAAGSYTVVVRSSPTCATTSPASTVSVFPLPAAMASTAASQICQGNTTVLSANAGPSLSYQWLSNNAIVPGAISVNFTANAPATYRVVVKNTFTTCEDTSSGILIKVNPLPAAAITPTAPAAICERDTVTFTANTGTKLSYQWRNGGSAISGAGANEYKAVQSGSYAVLVTDSNGCQKLSNVATLLVHPAPVAAITYTGQLEFCEGSAISLNALQSANLSYQWINNGVNLAGLTQPDQVIALSGNYSVRVVDNFNCSSLSGPVTVTVYPKPIPVISFDGRVLSTGNYISYQWFRNNVAIGAGGDAATYSPIEFGAYKVEVEDVNGCTGTSALFFLYNLSAAGPQAADAQVLVYPNPAASLITVESKGILKLKMIGVINTTGAVVQQLDAHSSKELLDLSALPAGLYYLRLETDAGVLIRKIEVLH